MKKYLVTYYVKKGHTGGREHVESRVVEATTAAEACATLKRLCREKLGFNAFRPSAKRVEVPAE